MTNNVFNNHNDRSIIDETDNNSRVIIVINSNRPRGRPRAFDRREALNQAMLVFWQHGYEGTSIAELTHALRITPQSLYAAFGSKEALYRESLALYRETVSSKGSRLLAEEQHVVTALEGILKAAIVEFTRSDCPRGCMISLGTLRCADEHRDIASHLAELRTDTTELLRARIEQGKVDGQLKPDVDPVALSAFISAIFQGMSVQARDGADEATLTGIAKLAIAEINRQRMD